MGSGACAGGGNPVQIQDPLRVVRKEDSRFTKGEMFRNGLGLIQCQAFIFQSQFHMSLLIFPEKSSDDMLSAEPRKLPGNEKLLGR